MRFLLAICVPLAVYAQDCTFRRDPDQFLSRQSRAYRRVFDQTAKFGARGAEGIRKTVEPSELPRVNFIDHVIFSKLEERGIRAAAISTDEEFLRRVTLDLTGRIPTPNDVRAFTSATEGNKRDLLIDRLLASSEFVDKWTMFFGDLLKNSAFPSNFDRQYNGRNNYHLWIRQQLTQNRSLRDTAKDLVAGSGNHFDLTWGAANFPIASKTPNGPVQDTTDTMLAMTASTFLGLGEMDCLLCHNGRGHLEQVNLWGSKLTRADAWRMAAFFSRLEMPQRNLPEGDPYWRSFDVRDKTTGSYDLNTNYGNRPDRSPIGAVRTITPEYLGGRTPGNANWRVAFAEMMVEDRMFAINFANRLWKEVFNLALVEPVDSLDPARLDPENPPDAPWSLQASHPELLLQLAGSLKAYDYNLRGFLRTLVQSTTYQLSSRYDGEWKYEYVNSFARHYPRRLMAEEIHDAVATATGVPGSYNVQGMGTLQWAMQLPEPAEPRSNGAVATFLNFFQRGNRDSQPRSSSLSILQQMYLMNDTFVTNRTRLTASASMQYASKFQWNEEIVDELYLLFLSRKPTAAERTVGIEYLAGAKDANERNTFVEDLAWVLVNKPEFIFSY